MKFSDKWRGFLSALWRSGLADDKRLAGGVDDLAPFLNAARGESDSGMPGRSRVLDRRVNLTDAVSHIGMVQEGVDELS